MSKDVIEIIVCNNQRFQGRLATGCHGQLKSKDRLQGQRYKERIIQFNFFEISKVQMFDINQSFAFPTYHHLKVLFETCSMHVALKYLLDLSKTESKVQQCLHMTLDIKSSRGNAKLKDFLALFYILVTKQLFVCFSSVRQELLSVNRQYALFGQSSTKINY